MRSGLWAVSVLVTAVLAAPPYAPVAGDPDALSQYFELLAVKVQRTEDDAMIPSCDLTKAQMPSSTLSYSQYPVLVTDHLQIPSHHPPASP